MDYRTLLCSIHHEMCAGELDRCPGASHSPRMDTMGMRDRLGRARDRAGPLVELAVAGLFALGCAHGGQTGEEADGSGMGKGEVIHEIRGTAERLEATGPEKGPASADNQDFAWRIFALESTPDQNTVLSPYSISVAAAMLSAGAGGETLSEIREALGFTTEGDAFHAAHNRLLQSLEARNHEGSEETNAQTLKLTNDFWMLPELRPTEAFLDVLSAYYGIGVHLARFDTKPEASRQAINAKVAEDTGQLIDELLPEGSIDAAVVFVLTNAIYFKANWAEEFTPSLTERLPFQTNAGESLETPLMHNASFEARYEAASDFTAVALPYFGEELELVAIMPTLGTFESFVQGLDAARVESILGGLESGLVDLRFPKFEIEAEVPLKEHLQALGMVQAFSSISADFGLIAPGVYISDAFHDATLILDEEGTEAAAATAFVGSQTSAPIDTPVPLVFDHPFVFLIRDVPTDATLFVGQFVSPE
jgi:serpin B